MMELTCLPKLLSTSDNKLLHHHFPDILATVRTTQDIPEEVVFGPCMLQNTLLDTVAFIALKCSDRRNIQYVFKVDITSVHSPTGLPWMRLVQAAANRKEQNLEAYLENSQLYYRSTRKINKNEELLVWYDEELSSLLGFNEIKAQSPQNELRCQGCDRVFKCEHSYLSHVRFLCVPEKSTPLWRNFQNLKPEKSNLAEQTTNFHSLARDVEVKMAACKDDALGFTREKRAKSEDAENNRSRKTVLLEKTNYLSEEHNCGVKEEVGHASADSSWKLNSGRQSARKDALEQKQSAFTEVRRMKEKLRNEKLKKPEQEDGEVPLGKDHISKEVLLNSSGSAFSFVWPTRTQEQKSAFSKPSSCLSERNAVNSSHPMGDSPKILGDLSGFIDTTDIMCCSTLLNSKFFVSDLCNAQMLQTNISQSNVFPYTSEPWPKQAAGQLQNTTTTSSSSSSSSLTLLPPTFTSFGVAAQNWCAKCNLSFCMTSDLVFHMRSHHKKEYSSTQSQFKRRREEKLTCPICHEYFQERHHLSRHMTSHN
ncbi:zinc finger protein 488 [Heliangelus exortis]|uniref:zinc finger protein 488 n=1 Tax=Heliangelus exortis TaxID=472823 RepID=UPI003A9575DA